MSSTNPPDASAAPRSDQEPVVSGSTTTSRSAARQKVGKACENCRRRKVKCDAVKPSCGSCLAFNDECQWSERIDYRKPLSRQQVDALRTRIADLESLLRTHGIDPIEGSGGMLVSSQATGSGAEGMDVNTPGVLRRMSSRKVTDLGVSVGMDGSDVLERGEVPNDLDDWPSTHLIENETGEFQVFGPTSSLRHLVSLRQSERTRPLGQEPSRQHIKTDQGGIVFSSNPTERVAATPARHQYEDIEFRRFLPRDIQISRLEHDKALDCFFRYHASWGQQTHPIHFREDMEVALSPRPGSSDETPRTAHYSPMLHNAILSIGLRFSDDPQLRAIDTLKLFCDEAKKHMRKEGMNPSVATVQALAHLASHHNLMAEHNLGWLQIGMAVRCGLTMGLNVDPALLVRGGRLTEAQARDRNVTYWMTFVQEGLWAPYIGRPVNWPAHTTPPPQVDTDLDLLPWIAPRGRLALDHQPGMISSAFIETVKLMAIGDKILNTLYGITADLVALSRSGTISEISLSLSTWLESLPPALKLNSHSIKSALPHVLTMHLGWASFMIMLHKPFYRPVAQLPSGGPPSNVNAETAVKQCDRAALQIVSLIQTWSKLHDLRFAPPPVLECCFTAGTTHLLAYTCAKTQKKRFDALQRVRECIEPMKIMAETWPAARQKQDLLEGLLEQYSKDKEEETEEQINLCQEVKLEQDALFSEMPHLGLSDHSIDLPDYGAFGVPGSTSAATSNYTQDHSWRITSASNHQARFPMESANFALSGSSNANHSQGSRDVSHQYNTLPLPNWLPDMRQDYLPADMQGPDSMAFAPPYDFDLAAFDEAIPAEWNIDQLALLNSQVWLEQSNRQDDLGRSAGQR